MQGIYIVANDKVTENAIALLNSIRCYDQEVLIYLIPFNENYQQVFNIIKEKHQVKLFPDLEFVDKFTEKIATIFDRDFLALPNKMRKLVQWFGPLDEFLYIDTDILVFEKISETLNYLHEYEFINCDYHFKGRGLTDIFSNVIKEKNIFTDEQLQDVFNSGFWGSKKSVFTEEKLYQLLKECAENREYFDFSSQTTDQPILNYLILKSTTKRLNLVKIAENEPGSWAGSPHFQEQDHILYDKGKKLKYLHWAGIKINENSPYRELWEYYRYLGEEKPEKININNNKKKWWQKIKSKLKFN
jgi:hypothetical protein